MSDAASFDTLVSRITGCRDDGDGIETKKHIVSTHVSTSQGDLLLTLCALHRAQAIVLSGDSLLAALKWQAPAEPPPKPPVGQATADPGFFLVSVLDGCAPADMAAAVRAYLGSNEGLDRIEIITYVAERGFVTYEADALMSEDCVSWAPPAAEETTTTTAARWRDAWGEGEMPLGKAWYATLSKQRGGRCKIAFLGSSTPDAPLLSRPSDLSKAWKLPSPSMLVSADAGSMHPTQCDSMNRMAHLPQFHECASHTHLAHCLSVLRICCRPMLLHAFLPLHDLAE